MLEKTIEELLYYGVKHLNLCEEDVMYVRNLLLHEFGLLEPYDGELDLSFIDELETPTTIINHLKEDVTDISPEMIERVMGLLSPMPSVLNQKFNELKAKNPKEACEYFYDLMIKNNYIKMDDIKKNLSWIYEGGNNNLKITVNLAKPEKDNKDIAKLVKSVSTSYPKCALCYSNLGFYGGNSKAARTNIRVVDLKLDGEDWFMQYSPYAYYDEHAIIISKTHSPMHITPSTFRKLMEFTDEFPNYFVGSNSDLPIVGGSILNHEHFQGGKERMPMMSSRVRYELKTDKENLKVYYQDWLNSTFKLVSSDKELLVSEATKILDTWESYDDLDQLIISNDEEGRHSTVTPICEKINGEYNLYIILRNNKCNSEYPDGIYHAHPEYHNIKKEGIGLIEAMGLFILPGRLTKELDLVKEILSNQNKPVREIVEAHPEIEKHLDFINKLIVKYRRNNTYEVASEIVNVEVGRVCENILKNTGVFKDTIDGQLALFKFFNKLGYEVVENE